MTIEIQRADPTGVAPDDNPATAVPLTDPDSAVIVVGTKMYGSSDVGFISRSNQQRLIGHQSNGKFGSTYRTQPSHGQTVVIGFDVVRIPSETMARMDQFVKDQLADLIYRKYVIVTEDGGARFTPDDMRSYAITP